MLQKLFKGNCGNTVLTSKILISMNFFTGANPEDPRYYNIHTAPPPVLSNGTELYPGGLWGPGSRSTSETDGCYWNPPGSQHSQQQRSSGNIYSPNPEEMHRNATENEQENDETNQESR